MQTIVANFDGMNFLVVARSWYDPSIIAQEYNSLVSDRGERYFAAHYPLYALVIALFDKVTSGSNAILLSIVVNNALVAIAVWLLMGTLIKDKKWALLLATLALFFPARMLAVRGVGSNEPLMIFLSIISLLACLRQKDYLAAVFGSLAVLTRSPAILLFVAYFVHFATLSATWSTKIKRFVPYLLMPLSLVALWVYYGFVYGDFWAYFRVGGNINLSFPPLLVFGADQPWVGETWLEDIVYTYLFVGGGVVLLWNKLKSDQNLRIIAIYGLTYLTALLFIVHRDIARYSLPIAPLAILGYGISYMPKKIPWLLLLIILPVFFYSWNFVQGNVQPIADWAPFL